jgi:hypothetical protein
MKPTSILSLVLLFGCSENPPATVAPTLATLQQRAAQLEPELIELRRTIHQNPELAGREVQTAALIAERLTALGLEVRTSVGGNVTSLSDGGALHDGAGRYEWCTLGL